MCIFLLYKIFNNIHLDLISFIGIYGHNYLKRHKFPMRLPGIVASHKRIA